MEVLSLSAPALIVLAPSTVALRYMRMLTMSMKESRLKRKYTERLFNKKVNRVMPFFFSHDPDM